MASQCKRQQCTIDRRGFRQELDSWRHKLIHCVGFESILEGLFGSELVEDLKLFKDLEPVTVSDWSFDENCLFCCLRRDKVKEHLIGNEGLQDTLKPLLVKDQITISRLEKQAEEFLNAVLCKKDVPSFLDPHIPVVAREILQRMIRQFAAEYTSKTSSPQDSSSDPQPSSDQSQPSPPLLSGAPPSSPAASLAGSAHNQNPVLSKLLMADQDAPLDLTIKKPQSEPSEQEGVLDLSIKKNRHSSCLPVHSSCLSPVTSSLKGECPDVRLVKAKELQSTSTLEQFMAKLCRHHQRQIVDAIGFLQTEVKALASSKTQQTFVPASRIQGTACSTPKSSTISPEKSELRILSETNLKPEVQDMSHSFLDSCVMKKSPETIVAFKTSVTAGPVLDLRSPGSGGNQALITSSVTPMDTDINRHSDHAPLKMKIMKTSNIAAGKKLSCVLTSSLSSDSGTLEDRQGNSNSSSRTETHGARLSSSVKRHNQLSHVHQARQRDTLGHAKDVSAKPYSVHTTIPVESPRTARKTIRGSAEHQNRDSACRGIVDPELGHCDIVYIDKPITECLKEQQRNMLPRRNARKSTRGHMYSDEIWEIKTVRTLAGRGNCPNPMPEMTTLVTPKQVLSKPEGVPPVDMPFAGTCRETMIEQMSTEDSDERVIPGTGDMVEEAASEADVVVETSQTDQCQSKTQVAPPPLAAPENRETDLTTDIEQDTTEDSGKTESQESIVLPPFEVEETCEPQPHENTESQQVVSETIAEAVENQSVEETEPQLRSDNMQSNEPVLEQTSTATPMNQAEEGMGGSERETVQAEQPLEPQSDAQTICDNTEETKGSAQEMLNEPETATAEADNVMLFEPVEMVQEDDDDYDVSSKTLDSLLKELPPWRRKKGTRILLPKRLRQTETVIVGYVNGRPISASDRSLRRRLGSTSPGRTPVKSSPIKVSVESGIEFANLDAAETPANLISIPTPLVKEPPSETSLSPPTKSPSGVAKSPKCKKSKTDQDGSPTVPEQPLDSPKRQLRSTSQKPGGTAASPSNSATSVPSPKHIATQDSTPSPPPPPPPPPPPSVPPSPPVAPDQVECSPVQEVPMEINSEDPQPVVTTAEETTEIASESLQTPSPAKPGVDACENDQQQHGSEESGAGENQTPIKAETPIVPPRAKRALRNNAEASDAAPMQKPDVASLEDGLAQADDGEPSTPEKPTRMPLRSESSKVESTPEAVPQSPVDANKKLTLRSQKSPVSPVSPVSSGTSRQAAGRQGDAASPVRLPERSTKAQARPPSFPAERMLPHSSSTSSRSEPPKQTNKFFEALTGEDNQQMLTNLNIKYDKMQKGWVQMDKEGQPTTKYRNKADRQAAIWKSKRRARKPKSSDHQKYSPVQMLFMKGFDLTSICRWFLESTETKSLVIVKKVNTRLPSETQLCFHSSSGGSGTSQGVFPSLQAERLKKHLKKFAIASPVKSNPKSQKLIAKALEQEANLVRGKERREPPCTMQTSASQAPAKRAESQKTSGKTKNPASARILRKYSNIREKMQVQQTNVRLKDGPKRLQANSLKRLTGVKAASRSNLKPSLKAQRPPVPVSRQMKESAAKMEKRKTFASKKASKPPVRERAVRAQSSARPSRDATRKDLPKRCSQRLGSPKVSDKTDNLGDAPKSKTDKKPPVAAVKEEPEKPAVSKTNVAKVHAKEESVEHPVESPQQSKEAKAPPAAPPPAAAAAAAAAADQVLTRSQRKMEATAPTTSAAQPAKKAGKSTAKTVRKAAEPSAAAKTVSRPPAKRSQAAMLPRSATKSATKRAQALLAIPAKRTRTSK